MYLAELPCCEGCADQALGSVRFARMGAAPDSGPPVALLADVQADDRQTLEDFLNIMGKLALLVNLVR